MERDFSTIGDKHSRTLIPAVQFKFDFIEQMCAPVCMRVNIYTTAVYIGTCIFVASIYFSIFSQSCKIVRPRNSIKCLASMYLR